MESKQYARSARRTRRTRIHPDAELAQGLAATGKLSIVPPTQGQRWKGIVDGTEVRYSERWKPSRTSGATRMTTNRPKATVGRVNVQTDRDLKLLATMASIHVGANH